jgi:hypothetical protein
MGKLKDFFFYYIPYRFYKYYEDQPTRDFSTYIAIVAIISINLWSIYALVSVYFGFEMMLFKTRFYNKFVFLPIVASPIFLFVYYYYKSNKSKYEEMFISYDKNHRNRNKVSTRPSALLDFLGQQVFDVVH